MLLPSLLHRRAVLFFLALLMLAVPEGRAQGRRAQTHRVPEDAPTIQAAIDVAADGDTVLVAPGTYEERLTLRGKNLVLGSRFLTTGDTSYAARTVIDGGGGEDTAALHVEGTRADRTALVGLTLQNADDCIYANGHFQLLHSRITRCTDGIDYETGSGGVVRRSRFFENADDGIDLDEDVSILIEENVIQGNEDDGIEIRLHAYAGPTLEYVIRRNTITGNGEDGIQLIDYPDTSDRTFLIEENAIQGNAMAGIGCMSGGETTETYEAARIPEPIRLVGNTLEGNARAVTCAGL